MEDKKLTEKESLELISRMIQNTRAKLEENSGTAFLVWGYTTIIVSMLVWGALCLTGDFRCHWLWFLLPLIGLPLYLIISKRQERKPRAATYVDKVVAYIWMVIGCSGFALSVLTFFIHIPILFIIVLMMGIGTTLTGLVIRFKPIVYSGILGIACSYILLFYGWYVQIPVFAVVFLIMMVIPGHILNHAARENAK